MDKSKHVHICVVTSRKPKRSHKSGSKKKKKLLPLETQRLGLIDSYKITEVWLLQDLVLLDGRNVDVVRKELPVFSFVLCQTECLSEWLASSMELDRKTW